jgi:hypothetical protein
MAKMTHNPHALYRRWSRSKLMRRLLDLGVQMDGLHEYEQVVGQEKAAIFASNVNEQAEAIMDLLNEKGVTDARCIAIYSGCKDLIS